MRERDEPDRMMGMRADGADTERALVDQAVRGDRGAFDALFATHAEPAWRLAMAIGGRPDEAETAVAESFGWVLAQPDKVGATRKPVGGQLLLATRHAMVEREGPTGPALHSVRTRPAPHLADAPDDPVLDAFRRLPARWRTAVWLSDVEGRELVEVAAVLGLSPRGATQLASRARAGLREQHAQAQLAEATTADCQRTTLRLSGYVSGTLAGRDPVRVRRHLDRCAECRARLDEVDDLAARLGRFAPPVPSTLHDAAVTAWVARLKPAGGPLGLTLPGGRPVPAWAERSLAGATAAVVALGIMGAVIAGGRGKDRSVPVAGTDSSIGAADGESALGDDGYGAVSDEFPSYDELLAMRDASAAADAGSGSSGTGTAAGGPSSPSPAAPTSPGDLPRGPSSPAPPVTPDGPGPSTPPTTPPPAEAPPLISVRLDDDTAVSVGGACTGAEVLGQVVGCEPAAAAALGGAGPSPLAPVTKALSL